jgi:endoglucanase
LKLPVRIVVFKIALWLAVCLPLARDAASDPIVHISQIGYSDTDHKWVSVAAPADSFEVRHAGTDEIVMKGALYLRRAADPASGDDVYQGDFDSLSMHGTYYVHVAGVGDSPEFVISDITYDNMYRAFLKGLYYQRCGTEITSEYGGDWTHGSCHDSGGGIASYDWVTTGGPPGGYRNTIGGWHDAGDYGKYSTNNAYTVGILLQAYETFSDRYSHDNCDIPESGNGIPDILDEARWSLEWMLKMQDGDGGVRHRESVPDYVLACPDEDMTTRYYTDISSDATAVHCAAMALAGRTYRVFDPSFAAACSISAESAWIWLEAHPDRVPPGGFVNLYGHQCATYAEGSEIGRRLWAAAEIFRLTGDTAARDYVDAHWGEDKDFNGVWYPDSWGDLANMGAFSYRDTPGATPGIVSGSWWSIETSTSSSCGTWNARVNGDGYGCVASTAGAYGDYYWGFTGVILRYAWTLIQGYRYTGNSAYRDAALEQLHYILGRNPMGKVYITGVGARPVLHAHGAWNHCAGYTAIEDSLCHPVPYLLVGGPNKQGNDWLSPCPGKCYEDIADSNYYYLGNYTLNETSVNIQASLIVLAGYFSTGGAGAGSESPQESPASGLDLICSNPFRSKTVLCYALPVEEHVRLIVYDIKGRLVTTLLDEHTPAGRHSISWNGCDRYGREATTGMYFAVLSTPSLSRCTKLILIR